MGEIPVVSIQDDVSWLAPTLTEAANGTSENCTGFDTCFICAAWLVERWGRKSTCMLMLLGSAAAAYFYGQSAATQAPVSQLIGAGLCMQFFMFGMWSVLYAYTPELYPTRSRATGAGFASSIGRIGSLIGPYVVGLVLPVAGQVGVFSLGAACFVAAALVVLLLGVETKGRSLEEVSH